MKEKSCIYNP